MKISQTWNIGHQLYIAQISVTDLIMGDYTNDVDWRILYNCIVLCVLIMLLIPKQKSSVYCEGIKRLMYVGNLFLNLDRWLDCDSGRPAVDLARSRISVSPVPWEQARVGEFLNIGDFFVENNKTPQIEHPTWPRIKNVRNHQTYRFLDNQNGSLFKIILFSDRSFYNC